MTQLLNHVEPTVRDFTRQRKIQFRVDHADGQPDVFDCVPAIPAMLMVEFVSKMDAAGQSEDIAAQTAIFSEIFSIILPEGQAQHFLARMSDKDDPIDLGQVMDIVQYAMEEYGLRPTTLSGPPAEPSASPESGTSSEVNSSSAAVSPSSSSTPASSSTPPTTSS